MSAGYTCKEVPNGYSSRYEWVVDGLKLYSPIEMKLPLDNFSKMFFPKYVDEWPAKDRQLLNRVLKRTEVVE
jgi:hypothetical protein